MKNPAAAHLVPMRTDADRSNPIAKHGGETSPKYFIGTLSNFCRIAKPSSGDHLMGEPFQTTGLDIDVSMQCFQNTCAWELALNRVRFSRA